jgi:hypothetical protein
MAKTIILELDDADYEAVQRCIARRQSFRSWPDATSQADSDDEFSEPLKDGSNLVGLAVAEICRGWEEMMAMWPDDEGEEWKR